MFSTSINTIKSHEGTESIDAFLSNRASILHIYKLHKLVVEADLRGGNYRPCSN